MDLNKHIAAIIKRNPNQPDYCAERIVKLVEENCHSLQQLKAEIAALATELDDFNMHRISQFGRVDEIAAKMRQLSAV